MFYEILAGIVLSLSYLAGALIYFGTKDECIPFAEKYSWLHELAKKSFYPKVVIVALLAGYLVTTIYKEVILVFFLVGIIQMSLVSANKRNKEVILLAIKSAVLFIVLFLVNYVALSHFLINF